MRGHKITEIRWHGRGGQGAVTSAELLALAAINEGKFAQAMPSFGPERRGAPVLAFNRVNNENPIRVRSSVTEPDIAVVLDPGLLYITDVTAGLQEGGALVINTPKSIKDIEHEFGGPWKLAVINASSIAKKVLGVPIVNTTMLGALIRTTGIIQIKSLEEPLEERFGLRAKNNMSACEAAFDAVEIAEAVEASSKKINLYYSSFQTEVLPTWRELLPGCVVTEPGSASAYRTGDWKSQSPITDYTRCNKCGICYISCPEGCIEQKDDSGYFQCNLYYCKGCGTCAKECPRNAITMIEET